MSVAGSPSSGMGVGGGSEEKFCNRHERSVIAVQLNGGGGGG